MPSSTVAPTNGQTDNMTEVAESKVTAAPVNRKCKIALSFFDTFNPVKAVTVVHNTELQKQRRKLDAILTIIFLSGLLVFAVFEGISSYDENHFEGACYSTGSSSIPGSKTLKVKHLCYTKEKPDNAGFAFLTYTCRGIFGGDKWGVISNSGSGGKRRNLNQNNQNNNNQNNNNQNQSKPSGGAEIVVPFDKQPDFCSLVIHSEDAELRVFVNAQSQDGCHGGGCREGVNKTKTYTFLGDTTSDKYYAVDGDQPGGMHQLTCCGMRVLGGADRTFLYLAGIGGFAAILRSLVQFVPFCGSRKSYAQRVKNLPSTALKAINAV